MTPVLIAISLVLILVSKTKLSSIILYFIANKYINPNILAIVCLSISVFVSILISIIYTKLKTLCNKEEITFQQ